MKGYAWCKFLGAISLIIGLSVVLTPSVHAQDSPNKGLFISPLRKEVSVSAGKVSSNYFSVANLTNKEMNVQFSVREFSVTDFAYDYTFRNPGNDWVKIKQKSIKLFPGDSAKIWYDIAAPERVAPGGYYYALFASTEVEGEGLPGTIQAVSLLYTKVDGKLLTTSVLQNESAPLIVMGDKVNYKFDVKNTGNVHFSAYFYGQLEGLFGIKIEQGTSHLVMPNAPRSIEGSVDSPLLPGIYKFTYGYKVDFADIITSKSTYIIYMPPWSIVVLLLVAITVNWLLQRRRSEIKNSKTN